MTEGRGRAPLRARADRRGTGRCEMSLLILRAGLGLALALFIATPLQAAAKLDRKLRNATEVYQELLDSPDRGVPERLRRESRCVAVVPRVIKAALGVGGRHGTGVVSCRDEGGSWSPPSFISLSGGSIGFQIGAQSTDLVLFFMNERGTRSLLKSRFTLGADASVAAGPVGRTAEAGTDIRFDAEIYAYARAKGLFAGVSLEGAVLDASDGKNEQYYGQEIDPATILFDQKVPRVPAPAREFVDALSGRG